VEDMLGSSRTIVQTGQTSPCYDADFYPYGAENVVTNTCPQNYKFEGKERDTETGNDDFGARYYSSVYGRWLSPDWSSIPAPVPYANLSNPQTLNLYAMVRDNPESFADLDGHGCDDNAASCDNHGNNNSSPSPLIGKAMLTYNAAVAGKGGSQDKTAKPKGKDGEKPASKKENSGDHVFIIVGAGLGLGGDFKMGAVKGAAEVSVTSEGHYTLSGKADVSTKESEELSGNIAGYGAGVGHSSEDTYHYDTLTTDAPTGDPQHEESNGLTMKTPHGGSADIDHNSISFSLGGCFVVCAKIGVGVQ